MDIRDIIQRGLCLDPLKGSVAGKVFDEVAEAFVHAGVLPPERSVSLRTAFVDRERQGTTAFVPGFAVPHVFLEGVVEPRLLVARHPTGIDMASLDGLPTKIFVCIVAAESHRDRYLELLRYVASVTRDRRYRRLMDQSLRARDVLEVLASADVT